VASGCSGKAADQQSESAVVNVGERDFRISAPKRVPAGDVVLKVHNRGPDHHELIVVRSADGRLPLRADGGTVDEGALQHVEAGALEPGAPGVRDLQVHLTPGKYVLLCNMSGHYLGGMRALLLVQ